MAQNDLQQALALLNQQFGEIDELPQPITELFNGQLPFQTGLFLVELEERYEYATHQPTHPTLSEAMLGYVVQYTYSDLMKKTDFAFDGLPLQAIASISGAIRAKIEASNNDATWQAQEPGMDVKFESSVLVFADKVGVDLAILGFRLRLSGFNVA